MVNCESETADCRFVITDIEFDPRECTDHLIVFNAEHLRRILAKYVAYHNEGRTHVRSGRTLPARARSRGSETLLRIQSLAGCTIGMLASCIRKRQDQQRRQRAAEENDAKTLRVAAHNEQAPGNGPGACWIFLLICDQYLAVRPAPALNRKLRPTLKTFLVSLTSNATEAGPPTKQATSPHTTLCERLPKS